MSPIRAMAWKDVREHLRWAMLLMLGLTIGLVVALRESIYPQFQGNFGSTFALMTRMGFPAIGAALGFLTIVFEARGDRWAFLMHRPAARAKLFWGKLLGATVLYAAATILPLGGALWWLSAPGHVAMPFEWGLTLPTVADWLGGLVYVPTGLMVGLRAARWYGSRILPLGLPILSSLVLMVMPAFWMAVLWAAVVFGLMALAARAVFKAGLTGRHGALAKWGQGLVLIPGLAMLAGAAVAIVVSFTEREQRYTWRQYTVLKDGRVMQVEQSGYGIYQVRGPAGEPAPDLGEVTGWELLKPHQAPSCGFWMGVKNRRRQPMEDLWSRSYQGPERYFIPVHSNMLANEAWYYSRRTGRFEIFDRESRRHMGSVGPAGFVPHDQATTDRFPGDATSVADWVGEGRATVVSTPTAWFRVHLTKRTVEAVRYTPPPNQQIKQARPWNELNVAEEKHTSVAMIADGHLINTPLEGGPILDIPLDEELEAGMAVVELYRVGPGYLLTRSPRDPETSLPQGLEVYDVEAATGRLTRRAEYPALPYPTPMRDYVREWVGGMAAAPAGLGLMVVYGMFQQWQLDLPWAYMVRRILPFLLPGMGGIVVSALVGAAGCGWLARREQLTRRATVTWVVVGGLLGIIGLLLMWCIEEVTGRVKCAACGRGHPVREARCPACNVAAAGPVLDGSEVFAPLG